jgi:PEP-CTERM motif
MKKFFMMPVVLMTLATLAIVPAHAQTIIASDNASGYSVVNGNQGFGFQGWSVNNGGNSGAFVFTSGDNGGSPNIDTSSKAWGFYANSGDSVTASRSFNTSLVTNNQFSVLMDNGGLDNAGSFDSVSLHSGGTSIFSVRFVNGGPGKYEFLNEGAATATTLDWTNSGLSISFTLTSPTTYDFSITPLAGGAPYTGSQTFSGVPINRFVAVNSNAGNGAGANLYVNSLSIAAIPEPTTLALFGLGVCGLVAKRRKK